MTSKIEFKKPAPKTKISFFVPVDINEGVKKVAAEEKIPLSAVWGQVMRSFLVERKILSK